MKHSNKTNTYELPIQFRKLDIINTLTFPKCCFLVPFSAFLPMPSPSTSCITTLVPFFPNSLDFLYCLATPACVAKLYLVYLCLL